MAMENVTDLNIKPEISYPSIGSVHNNNMAPYLGPEKSKHALDNETIVDSFNLF